MKREYALSKFISMKTVRLMGKWKFFQKSSDTIFRMRFN